MRFAINNTVRPFQVSHSDSTRIERSGLPKISRNRSACLARVATHVGPSCEPASAVAAENGPFHAPVEASVLKQLVADAAAGFLPDRRASHFSLTAFRFLSVVSPSAYCSASSTASRSSWFGIWSHTRHAHANSLSFRGSSQSSSIGSGSVHTSHWSAVSTTTGKRCEGRMRGCPGGRERGPDADCNIARAFTLVRGLGSRGGV